MKEPSEIVQLGISIPDKFNMTGIELKSITQVHAYRDITFCNSKGDRKATRENTEEILNTLNSATGKTYTSKECGTH